VARFVAALVTLITFSTIAQARTIEVALTFDDLPFVSPTPPGQDRTQLIKDIIAVLRKHRIPKTFAFVNGERADGNREGMRILKYWVRSGHLIGNHTYEHPDLNLLSSADYIANIERNEQMLQTLFCNGQA
jgi:peptidoglycan-N-acetylglucosamine deacetylase